MSTVMATWRRPGLARDTDSQQVDLRRHHCVVFGCDVELACVGAPQTPFAEVEHHLRRLETRFSRFVSGNELDRFSTSEGRWTTISAEMERLLTHALRVAVASHGLVNIAVTTAVRRAGYVASWPAPWEPAPTELAGTGTEAAAVPPLTEILELRRGQARLRPGSAVDFGAIAKGLWADDVVTLLGEDAAAGLGGDVAAHGGGPAGSGWPIGLPGGRTLLVTDGGVATSGTTKRCQAGAHHVIDPRTGRPSRSGVAEISVLASCATTAEWVATALLIDEVDEAGLLARADVYARFAVPDQIHQSQQE